MSVTSAKAAGAVDRSTLEPADPQRPNPALPAPWVNKPMSALLSRRPRRRLSFVVLPGLLLLLIASLAGVGCGSDSAGPNLQPSLSGADPDTGTVGTQVAITGADFAVGLTVEFSGLPATNVVVQSPSTVLVNAPAGLQAGTAYDIHVTNPGGKSADLLQAFRAVPPVLLVVNGVTKPSGTAGSTIIFEGKAFGDLAGNGSVWFSDGSGSSVEAPVTSDDNWTDEFVVTTVPNSAGSGPVWITTATGASDSVDFSVASGATFSPSQINWTATTPLPAPSQGHAAAFLSGEDIGTDNVIYVSGGADGAVVPRADVWRAISDPSGAIGTWGAETSLPTPRAFHRMVVATPFNALVDTTQAGYAFVLGGLDAAGNALSSVISAPIGTDRTIGSWTAEPDLPEALHSTSALIFRSYVFVIGGAGIANAPSASVYRAPILSDGHLGAWEAQTPLPAPRACATAVQFAGALFMVGGDGGTVDPGSATVSQSELGSILRNPLDLRSRTLGTWTTNPGSLIKSVAKHSALVAGGSILVSGGTYNGDGNSATEHQYASFQLDGTIGSFGGATGSQTIGGSSGAGGQPFFNHAAVAYVDAGGVAHVVILGGNDVTDPTTPLAETYYY